MNLTILQTLNEAGFRFEQTTGQKPTHLFLGHQEFRELKSIAMTFAVKQTDFTTRPHFNNIPIYEVDADRFVGFGYSNPL